jgi:hypothetical protein
VTSFDSQTMRKFRRHVVPDSTKSISATKGLKIWDKSFSIGFILIHDRK